MGANYSNEVFKPPEEPTYTPEALNIQWIGDTTKKVPVVIYEWIGRNKEKGEQIFFFVTKKINHILNYSSLYTIIFWRK